jgi:hypothetical protein
MKAMQILALLLGVLTAGCSVLKEPEAYAAIAADTATTAVALSRSGFVATTAWPPRTGRWGSS